MIVWHPDLVTVAQFAARIRQHLDGRGYIFTPEVGWAYLIHGGVLHRVNTAQDTIQPLMTVEDAATMDDETLVQRCKG